MNEILVKQLAIDFCTEEGAVTSRENIFTVYTPLQGRRIFEEGECFLKIACINGKILASGKKDIIAWVRKTFKDRSGAWFMESFLAWRALQATATACGRLELM